MTMSTMTWIMTTHTIRIINSKKQTTLFNRSRLTRVRTFNPAQVRISRRIFTIIAQSWFLRSFWNDTRNGLVRPCTWIKQRLRRELKRRRRSYSLRNSILLQRRSVITRSTPTTRRRWMGLALLKFIAGLVRTYFTHTTIAFFFLWLCLIDFVCFHWLPYPPIQLKSDMVEKMELTHSEGAVHKLKMGNLSIPMQEFISAG